jgi:hypothetical protein
MVDEPTETTHAGGWASEWTMATGVAGDDGRRVVGRGRNAARTATSATSARPTDGVWRKVLERCRDLVQADSVIAVDGEGLAVAWVGPFDRVEASRVSAHVSKAFDLLDRLKYVGRLAESLCVMYWPEGTWLTAVRVAPEVSSVVTIAVVGPYTLVHKDRRRLRNTFTRLLEETRAD